MLAFAGTTLPDPVATRLRDAPAAGLTLFRYENVESPAQVRELTGAAQRASAQGGHATPLLIAADQEGGQLIALGNATTPFPGNMALAATGDVELAERVGHAHRLGGARDGRQRRLRPLVRPRHEPGQSAPRHPLVR